MSRRPSRAPAEEPLPSDTAANAASPFADPEAMNQTIDRGPRLGGRPRRDEQTKARPPPPRKSRGGAEEEYRTGSSYGELDESYDTGNNYEPLSSSEASAPVELSGDGLDALDPEVGPRTRGVDESGAEDSGGSMADASLDDEDANATQAGPPIKLEIIEGPDAGRKKKLRGVRMVIGRTPGVDLQLKDQSVSRRHVELVLGDEGVILRDLGSGNGTRVNGSRTAEKVLEHGDEIAIGKTKIRFVDEVSAFRKARESAEKEAAEGKKPEVKAAAAEVPSAEESAPDEAPPAEAEPAAEDPEAGASTRVNNPVAGAPVARPARGVRTARGARAQLEGLTARWQALNPRVRLGVLGFLAVLVLLWVTSLVLRPPPPPPVDPAQVAADEKMQEARNAARDNDFERAVQLVDEAEKLVPGIDRTKLGNQAREELAFSRVMAEARKLMEARRFEQVHTLLDGDRSASIRADAEKAAFRKELVKAEAAFRIEKIDEFLAAGDLEAARLTLAEVPLDQQEEPARKVAEFEAEMERQRALDDDQARRSAAASAAAAKARRAEEIAAAFVTVERKFAGGEWDRAASECSRVLDVYASDAQIKERARMLQRTIPAFGRAFDEGMKKFRAGALAQAARPLREAHRLYGALNLTANKYGGELAARLQESSVVAGKEALIREDLVTAYQNFRDATRFDPSDARARKGLIDVETKADDLFQSAYIVKDRDPREALRRFKVVVQVTDPNSAIHEKAKNHIAALQP